MSVYAIADTHLSFGTDKPMDTFPGWSDYVRRLEENWNRLVTPADTVVLAGDISWAMNFEELEKDFAFLNSLNGRKLLLKGNHDYWWNTAAKMNAFTQEHGFDTIEFLYNNSYTVEGVSLCGSRGWMFETGEPHDEKILNREAGRLRLSLESAACDEKIVFLHYPPVTVDQRCEELLAVLKEFGVRRCYYGHLHAMAARLAVDDELEGIRFRLISCDRLSFVPLLIKK